MNFMCFNHSRSSDTTDEVASQPVPMPVCRYELVNEQNATARFALIGQTIRHRWTCDTQYSLATFSRKATIAENVFCMIVHSCIVDGANKANESIQLLDENVVTRTVQMLCTFVFQGCSLDPTLLFDLDYETDLTASQTATVFKYANNEKLFFNCQIRITIKEALCPVGSITFSSQTFIAETQLYAAECEQCRR